MQSAVSTSKCSRVVASTSSTSSPVPLLVGSWRRSAADSAPARPESGRLLRQLNQTAVGARVCLCRGLASDDSEGRGSSGGEDYAAIASRLNVLYAGSQRITAEELRSLVFKKWGRTYDVRLHKRGSSMYLQVMWRFLEQQSFPLTPDEYMLQLEAVCEYLNDWGVADTVRQGIAKARDRGPGYTGGTSARCVSIPLDVDLSGARKGEWN